MKKLFPSLALFAGVVSAPMATVPMVPKSDPAPEYRTDPRLAALHSFFTRTDCPAVAYAFDFLRAADDYDLDWRLLPSISFVESTGGKAARNNNMFGWDSGNAEFTSAVAGIHQVGYRLAYSDLYRDKDTDEILATYNPDVSYAARVKSVMRQIAPSE